MRKALQTVLICALPWFLFAWKDVLAAPVAYIDQASFLEDLGAMAFAPVHEGFEDAAAWGDTRGQVVTTVTSQGIVWTANNPTSGITTGSGAALTGQYGFYSIPHGSYNDPAPGVTCFTPGECGDGWRGRAVGQLIYAIGGWIETNTPYAKIGLFIGDYPDNAVDFGQTCNPPESENCVGNSTIGTAHQFFGVIDTAGFEGFEFRELEGKLEPGGGDKKYIYADDFYFVVGDPGLIFKNGFE
jgi:hypothetical protein